jgi:hypothetical protein
VTLDESGIRLEGFCDAEREMITKACEALEEAAYDISVFKVLVRADMPAAYRGMTLEDGAALGEAAFFSQAMLNHVLEEELLHQQQRARGDAAEFGPGTMRELEEQLHGARKFPLPDA